MVSSGWHWAGISGWLSDVVINCYSDKLDARVNLIWQLQFDELSSRKASDADLFHLFINPDIIEFLDPYSFN